MVAMQDVWPVTEFGKTLEKIRRPLPKPTATQVLVKVSHSGVCHSDIHFWEGYWDMGSGKKFHVKDRGVELPIVMGHEILGNIVKAGPDAEPQGIGVWRAIYP